MIDVNPSYEALFGAGLGFIGVLLMNVGRKRPIYSNLYKHPIGAGIGYFVGCLVHHDAERRAKTNRIYIEDYVRLHPEDFVEPPPQYWKDVFRTWSPKR